MLRRRLLRGALWFVAVLFALGFWGGHLPREHIAMETVELAATPAQVYAVVRDLENAPSWRSDVKQVEALPPRGDRKVYRQRGDDGALTLEVVEDVPDKRFVTEIADLGLPFAGRWVFQLEPTASGGTRLTLAEIGDIQNPVLRLFAHHLFDLDAGIEQYLADLQALLAKSS
jgi:uncharacterized protein YndB with AHSA1/START domain